MAKQTINIGSGELAGNGESIRSAFSKINDNFDELYTNGGGGVGVTGPQGPSGAVGPTGPAGTGGTSISTSDIAPVDPELGDLWYDTVSGRIYIYYDSGWVDANPSVAGPTGPAGATPDFSAVAEHIIPAEDLTYDLGSTSSQWRSLYVGTSTVYFGSIPLRVTSEGGIIVNNIPVLGGGSADTGNILFDGNDISNSADNAISVTTEKTITTNNSYTNTVDFSTDVDIGGGTVMSGWYQRTSEQIEFSLFGPSSFVTYSTGMALGRTVIVTYSTEGGDQTLTGTLTQQFTNISEQEDPDNLGWTRVSGRIDATLPVDQTGIVSVNFPEYSLQSYSWEFDTRGALRLPAGGTITEGVVTSNPTIQLTPASPDVASQKLVIKGGGAYTVEDNGIGLNWNEINPLVGDTVQIYVNSDTYADQTLYWWVSPAGAGILDTESGTVVLTGSSGEFSILIDSDDYEFRIRVSPEDNNYDPASIGVETQLFNSASPSFGDHHLHLTTGDLTETSIILGTDDHNVRTTTDGGVELNSRNYGDNVTHTLTFNISGELEFPQGSKLEEQAEETLAAETSGAIAADTQGNTPGLDNNNSILYIATAVLDQPWVVNRGYVRFADNTVFKISGYNTDAYGEDGGFVVLYESITKASGDVWPLEIFAPEEVITQSFEISSIFESWKFAANGILTLPGGGKLGRNTSDLNDTTRLTGGVEDPVALQVIGEGGISMTQVLLEDNQIVLSTNLATSADQREWIFGTDGSITFPDATVQTTAYVPDDNLVKFSGEWTLPDDTTAVYSFTVPSDGTYIMWVKGNIPNGIITWNATASVSNTNVPAIGTQYAWNYTGGGSPIELIDIPNQIRGVSGTISTDATYAGTTSNRFDFNISNSSGSTQTIYYGYTKIS